MYSDAKQHQYFIDDVIFNLRPVKLSQVCGHLCIFRKFENHSTGYILDFCILSMLY